MLFEALKRIATQGNTNMTKDELIIFVELFRSVNPPKIDEAQYTELQTILNPQQG